MKCIIIIIIVLMCTNSSAQRHFVGVRGGMNASSYSAENLSPRSGIQYGVIGGLTYQLHFHLHFYVAAEATLNQLGYRPAFTTIKTANTGQQSSTITVNTAGAYGMVRINMFSLPIKAGYTFGKTTYGFVTLGAMPSWVFNSKIVFPAGIIGNNELVIKSNEKDFLLGGILEVGIGYKCSQRIDIYTSLGYQHFTEEVEPSSQFNFEPFRFHLYAVTISAGLKYALIKASE